jgi:predicted small secreted protein
MKHVLRAFLIVVATAALTACNTLQGVGEDLQRAGETLEDVTT